jgi:hypothetical protein
MSSETLPPNWSWVKLGELVTNPKVILLLVHLALI